MLVCLFICQGIAVCKQKKMLACKICHPLSNTFLCYNLCEELMYHYVNMLIYVTVGITGRTSSV